MSERRPIRWWMPTSTGDVVTDFVILIITALFIILVAGVIKDPSVILGK